MASRYGEKVANSLVDPLTKYLVDLRKDVRAEVLPSLPKAEKILDAIFATKEIIKEIEKFPLVKKAIEMYQENKDETIAESPDTTQTMSDVEDDVLNSVPSSPTPTMTPTKNSFPISTPPFHPHLLTNKDTGQATRSSVTAKLKSTDGEFRDIVDIPLVKSFNRRNVLLIQDDDDDEDSQLIRHSKKKQKSSTDIIAAPRTTFVDHPLQPATVNQNDKMLSLVFPDTKVT